MMNGVILRYLFCIFIYISINTFCYSQTNYVSINDSINIYINEGLYEKASNRIVEYASYLGSIGDKKSALDYQKWNCNLVEEHLDYFFDHGLSLKEYFANRNMVCILYRDLGLKSDAIKTYLYIINDMKKVAPSQIPIITDFIAPILASYTETPLFDSIYSLSNTLDYIKNSKYEKKDVEMFVELANDFYINRFLNNKMEECDAWFNRYVGFINSLDTTFYKNEILNYYLNYIDILEIRASNASSQENDQLKAISLYEKAIETLEVIKSYDPSVQLRIASYNSEIGHNYFLLKDMSNSKIYIDKAYNDALFYKGTISLYYCKLLSNLALDFWNHHQQATAASIKQTEIALREKTSLEPPLISDYALLMMYNNGQPDTIISIGKKVFDTFGDTICTSMTYIYYYLAEAYSELMYEQILKGEQFKENKEKYEYYIEKALTTYELYLQHYKKHNNANQTFANIMEICAKHHLRLGDYATSFRLAEQAFLIDENSDRLFLNCLNAVSIHDENAIHKYLPMYYDYLENDLKSMLPLLGSVESEMYLQQGGHPIYNFIDWGVMNSKDSLCLSLAYNSALLTKNLYLNSSSLLPFITDESLYPEIEGLSILKDKILKEKKLNDRLVLAHEYELRERNLRLKVIERFKSTVFLKWNSIQEKLDIDEVAIEFIEYGEKEWLYSKKDAEKRYGALIITKTSSYPVFVDLFEVEIAKDVYEQQPKSYSEKLGYNIYNKLWETLAPYLKGASKVYFSPIGLLSLINIESLMDENGIAAFDRFPLSRVSSTKQILFQKPLAIESVALFGGVKYTTQKYDQPTFTLDSLNTRGNWAYLEETLSEIDEIESEVKRDKDNISVYKYIGEYASEEHLKDICKSSPSVLHIASHGFYIPEIKRSKVPYYNRDDTTLLSDNLFYSGLVLSGGQDSWNNSTFEIDANDGILSSYEISNLNLRKTDLVVLSACETGIGDLSYDGILGLQRGFKSAGVNTIIMSLWKVDDVATSFFMVNFYRKYLKTGSKGYAFREAQRIVREKFPDPYFWASFILLD